MSSTATSIWRVFTRNTPNAYWAKPEPVFVSLGSKRLFDVNFHVFIILTVRKDQCLTCWPIYLCWKRVLFPLSMTLFWPQDWPDYTSQDKNHNIALESNIGCRARLVVVTYLWNSS